MGQRWTSTWGGAAQWPPGKDSALYIFVIFLLINDSFQLNILFVFCTTVQLQCECCYGEIMKW